MGWMDAGLTCPHPSGRWSLPLGSGDPLGKDSTWVLERNLLQQQPGPILQPATSGDLGTRTPVLDAETGPASEPRASSCTWHRCGTV